MGKHEQQILSILKDGEKTDRQLANILLGKEKHQSPINQECRKLCQQGKIERTGSPILNSLKNEAINNNAVFGNKKTVCHLSEEETKIIIKEDLEKKGWTIDFLALGHKHGTDIIARKDEKRWFIEVKGCGSRNAMRVNYFLSVLGEILQRMDDPVADYSIAFPDMEQYRKLWDKLPLLAKERAQVRVVFVKDKSNIEYKDR